MNLLPSNVFLNSDHAPIIQTISVGKTNLNIASWNVLFEKWLRMNVSSKNKETGEVDPKGGHIGKYFPHLADAIPFERKAETEIQILKIIKYHNIDIFGIQEFDGNHLQELNETLNGKDLTGNYKIISPENLNGYLAEVEKDRSSKGNNDQQVIVYDSSKVEADLSKSTVIYYSEDKPNKRILSVLFKTIQDGTIFRFENTHVEFNKMNVFVDHIKTLDYTPTIFVGDMNQDETPPEVTSNNNYNIIDPNGNHASERHTHINTSGQKVIYDHIWTKNIKD